MRRPRRRAWQEEPAPRASLRVHALRRWWFAGVAAVAAVAVIVDLPSPAGSAYRRSQLAGYLSSVHGDVAQCSESLRQAVDTYVGWAEGAPGRTRGLAATFAHQTIEACGFLDAGVVDLGTTQPPRAAASPTVDLLAHQVDAWAYLDAFDTAQDLRSSVADPAGVSSHRTGRQVLAELGARRARIERLVAAAERAAGMRLRPLPLVAVGALLPAGVLPPPPGARS